MADEYRASQIGGGPRSNGTATRKSNTATTAATQQNGSNVDKSDDGIDYSDDDVCDDIARKFWKRLGPTMPPSVYGADMEGSLFDGAKASGWSIAELDNSLQLLAAEHECDDLPGVTTPYLYFGMWASVFCA